MPATRPVHHDPDPVPGDAEESSRTALSQNGSFSERVNREHWLSLLIVAATLLAVFAVAAIAVRLLLQIGHTLLLFALGALLAYALEPLVNGVRGRGQPSGRRRSRATSALLVLAGLFGLLALSGLLLSRPMAAQIKLLAANHIEYEQHARERLMAADAWLLTHGVRANLTGYLDNPPTAKGWSQVIAGKTLRVLEGISRSVVEGLVVVLIALYFLIYSEAMRRTTEQHLPLRVKSYAQQWMDDVSHILGGFVRGQLLLALTIGAMAALLCLAFGLRLWLLIGLFVVVASLVPVVGPLIGAIPAVIAALISPHAHFHPALRVVLLLACFGLINEIGSKILYPRLVGAALGLHEVLVLFVLFAGLEVGGLIGVLFAAPLTALAIVSGVHLYRFWEGLPPASVSQAAQRGGQDAKAQGTP